MPCTRQLPSRLLCLLILLGAGNAFVVHHRQQLEGGTIHWLARGRLGPPLAPTARMATEGDGKETAPRTRRRRRKAVPSEETNSKRAEVSATADAAVESNPEEAAAPLRPRQDAPVALQVTDVRRIVGGSSSGPAVATFSASSSSTKVDGTVNPSVTSGTRKDDASAFPLTSGAPQTNPDDSLARLLQDAKEMQAQGTGISGIDNKDGDDPSIPRMISSVLSTIVTVDFFVVCGFLLWFLAGIFSSYVLQDDGIQIAFNSNFETLVQPALGILMIAAIAGNFFKEEEEEQ